MTKNIVICSDGTNSTFDTNVSNVSRLIRLLALDDRQAQTVVYSQGVGTNARHLAALKAYRESIPDERSLVAVGRSEGWRFAPANLVARLAGLAAGFGVKANVRKMYCQLSRLYDGPEDRIFLFGFSRGAFTVRALAGLLHRCGLPGTDVTNCAVSFEDAWRLYEAYIEAQSTIAEFRYRHGQRDCIIQFLGLWDTVMSYGGLIQRTLPHLRHNPNVKIVRHAIALDEGRSWFQVRPWGLLDVDRIGDADAPDRLQLARQDVKEVWFRGSHSDVGGSATQEPSMNIALRWMVCEAAAAGIRLNEEGKSMLIDAPVLTAVDSSEVVTRKSRSREWWLSNIVPRWEIDNSGRFPTRKLTWGDTGRRQPNHLSRGQKVLIAGGSVPVKPSREN
jgi:uncharacterized protein (DUF2235 family)